MALVLTRDNIRLGNILQGEFGGHIGYQRKTVVVNEAAAVEYKLGEVLGKVTATGKYVRLTAGATDGSQNFAGVFIGTDDAYNPDNLSVPATTDTNAVIVYRGPAGIFSQALRFKSGTTQNQKNAVYAQIDAAGFKVI